MAAQAQEFLVNDNLNLRIIKEPQGFGQARSVLMDASVLGIAFYGATPVAQQVSGANVTNSVTVGGTTDTINDIVAATTDTSAAQLVATRNAIYQLAKKLKVVNDALRLYGILS